MTALEPRADIQGFVGAQLIYEWNANEKSGWRELYAGYVAQTATLVRLDATATDYAWRAYAVAEGDTHYAVGPWSRFTLR